MGPQRVLRASRAASFPRWLSQTEQDGLPDDRPPLLLTSRTPPLDPFRDPFRASREAGLPWWLPQNLQDGLPDDWPPSIEQPPPQRAPQVPKPMLLPVQDNP